MRGYDDLPIRSKIHRAWDQRRRLQRIHGHDALETCTRRGCGRPHAGCLPGASADPRPPSRPWRRTAGSSTSRASCPRRPRTRTSRAGGPGPRRAEGAPGRAGTSLDRVVSTSVYLAGADDFAALNTVWTKYWPAVASDADDGRREAPAAGRSHPGVGHRRRTGAPSARVVLPKGWAAPSGPYSYAIEIGDTLFLSGLVSRRGSGQHAREGRHRGADPRRLRERGRRSWRPRVSPSPTSSASRVFLTERRRLRPHERGLPHALPGQPARPGHGQDARSSRRLPDRDHDDGREGRTRRAAVLTPSADGSPGQREPEPELGDRRRAAAVPVGHARACCPGNAPDASSQTHRDAGPARTHDGGRPASRWPHVVDADRLRDRRRRRAGRCSTAFAARGGGGLPAGTLVGPGS